jgi:GTP-binding protein
MKTVAIVGRPNVGKSALFNRLAGRQISIVHDQPGVTRDRITAVCRLGSAPFEIIDTGGIGSEPDPDFAEETHLAAEVAIAAADLLLFVVDAQDGVTPLDRELAGRIRSSGRPVIVGVNKIDHPKQESWIAEFSAFGFDHVVSLSAVHGRGVGELVEVVDELLGLVAAGGEDAAEGEAPKLAIVGRPNVGKSSLINAILNDRRTIVSEIPGTTRDAVDIPYTHRDQRYVLVDTAGIRHRSKHNTSVEVFSVMRSEKAIERADLNILVIDATQGVTTQDKKIAGLMQKARKAALVVLNKWDLVKGEGLEPEVLAEKIEALKAELFFLDYAPVVVLSATSKENLPRLFNAIEKMQQHSTRRIGTGELNRILQAAFERQPPPMHANRRFKVYYATQVAPAKPHPFQRVEFMLFVNDPHKLSSSYESYLSARIRDHREFPGLPISFKLRGKERDQTEGRGAPARVTPRGKKTARRKA